MDFFQDVKLAVHSFISTLPLFGTERLTWRTSGRVYQKAEINSIDEACKMWEGGSFGSTRASLLIWRETIVDWRSRGQRGPPLPANDSLQICDRVHLVTQHTPTFNVLHIHTRSPGTKNTHADGRPLSGTCLRKCVFDCAGALRNCCFLSDENGFCVADSSKSFPLARRRRRRARGWRPCVRGRRESLTLKERLNTAPACVAGQRSGNN